jgi:CelD/BcsL family acetyltransferase involved in cellulose biosynthesis
MPLADVEDSQVGEEARPTGAAIRVVAGELTEDQFAALMPLWKELVSDGEYAAPFYQPEWFQAFGRAFVSHQTPCIVTAWSGSTLKGLLPLLKTDRFFGRIPARTIRSLSGIHSCRFDLIHDGKDAEKVAQAIWRELRDERSWDVIEVEDVPSAGAFCKVLVSAREDGFLTGQWSTRKSPYLSVPGPNHDPFMLCPKGFKSLRSRLKSKLRRLEHEHGKASFEVDQGHYQNLRGEFLALESSGWKGAKRSAIASHESTERFYSEVTDHLHHSRSLRFYALRVGAKPIAMQMGFVMNGVYYSPKVAYDETYAAFSPGQLLTQFVIADLARSGLHTFDFLGPRALWKCVWAPHVREHSNCYIFRPSIKGRLLHAITMRGAAYARLIRHRIKGDPQEISGGQST